ncbi:hypothetical protein KAH27_09300, partial [bacterium]|nr:hypothetical protein [bacterium]
MPYSSISHKINIQFKNPFLQFSISALLLFIISVTVLFSACQTNNNDSQAHNDSAKNNIPLELLYKYFPTRMHAFIWRNWESVPLDRLAKVLNTTTEKVFKAGRAMGLPPYREPGPEFEQRGYISLIRRNWNLISYEQILTLLNWNAE